MTLVRSRPVVLSAVAVLAAALAFALLTSCAKKDPAAKEHVVHIRGMLFQPATLQISRGDSITWINDDILMHAVKSTDPKNPWQSIDLPPRKSWTRTFTQGGPYFCPYHPPMTGEIAIAQTKNLASGH
ncbi:MAG TPA: hypothetical protein VHO24_11905 [Opitutaceae bacterium]|nr:hypothetical protein [Opitutaceae bacterium]